MPAKGKKKLRRRSAHRAWLAGAVFCLFLLLPTAAVAAKVPGLASTAQYKAFAEYVKKLDGLVGQPVTEAQKASFEAELTAKAKATTHKANALFNRSSQVAEAEFDAKFKEQAAAVRSAEGEELETSKVEARGKLERALASYQAKLERVAGGHEKFEAQARERIDLLRARKAAAADVAQKTAIQEQIATLIAEINAKRKEEVGKRSALKSAFRAQKQVIQTAAAKREAEIGEAAEAKIEKIAKHWKNAFVARKASLNSKRENQLGYLDAKLEKGRADIATMPAAG